MRHAVFLCAVLCVVTLVGAGCAPSSETSSTDTSISKSSTSSTSGAASQPDVYNHSVWLARSANGTSWSLDDEVLIEHASVPNITRFTTAVGDYPAGTLMIVYVDATEMPDGNNNAERTGRYVSTDNGKTWSDEGPVTYRGASGHVPVDPNLVQLPDGTLRMYYFDFSVATGGVVVADSDIQSHFYAADSTDGETFTVVGEIYSEERITDPEVVYTDGTYYMFYAWQDTTDSGIRVATSADGLDFTRTDIDGDLKGIPGVLLDGDTFTVFGCSSKGLVRYTGDASLSFDNGTSLGNAFQGGFCDPDPVELLDGSYLLVVKKLPAQTK